MTIQPFTDAAQTWNARFLGNAYLFGTEPNHYLLRQAHYWKSGDRVLCVADGEGRNSVWLAEQGLEVDAFDISEVGVHKGQALADTRNVAVHFSVEDCDSRTWIDSKYDGTVLAKTCGGEHYWQQMHSIGGVHLTGQSAHHARVEFPCPGRWPSTSGTV